MILLQLFIPKNDNNGEPFPQNIFTGIKEQLADKFGGVTSFAQNPAEGLWEEGGAVHKDIIVIYEVMM